MRVTSNIERSNINTFWKVILLTLAGLILLSGCKEPTFPIVELSYVSAYIPDPLYTHALTPDGSAITLNDLSQIDLQSGQISRPFDTYLSPEWHATYYINHLQWSFNGRYLAVDAIQVEPPEFSYNHPVYIIDTLSRSPSEPLNDLEAFYDWSPFGERLLTYPIFPAQGFAQVYAIEKESPLVRPQSVVNVQEEKNIHGSGLYLWGGTTNTPIAKVSLINPINFAGVVDNQEVGITLLSYDEDGVLHEGYSPPPAKFISLPPDNIVSAIFDPSGEYILIAQWKCSKEDPTQCTLYQSTPFDDIDQEPYFDSITDTFLILLRWRTGEEQELIRLSEIDPHNVVAQDIEWSADGSTILVWRKDAPPLVLKMQYP